MPKGYKFYTASEKLAIVKRYIAGEPYRKLSKETGISASSIKKWRGQYLKDGMEVLEPKKKPGNPLSKYTRKKELSREEELEYQVELLKRELLKKEADVVRLKKSIELKGGGAKRR